MDNPVRRARTQLKMTQELLAHEAGVHPQAVLLCEQGVHHGVLPSVREFLVREGFVGSVLDAEYRAFQADKRRVFGLKYHLAELELGAPNLERSPFSDLLLTLTIGRMRFAKDLCVHPASLYELERGRAHHLPEQLKEALTEGGMGAATIAELNFRTEEYARCAVR